MELSTYFRINQAGTGQFERTLSLLMKEVMFLILKVVQRHQETRTSFTLLLWN
jgi:Fe-S cluster assembly scaffold protein SufB